ncbi:MAG: two-component system osmolarity sensor histidine kinase EnvZ [Paracoccaceae bacterium]|jgi:two-component system osmolarity sensor histidine kinase EnvZ
MDISLKRYLPKSLFGRALMILIAPIVLLQIVVTGLFIQRHYAGVTEQMAGAVARELIYAVETVEAAPDAAAAQSMLDELARPLGLELSLLPNEAISLAARLRFYDVSGEALATTLRRYVSRPMGLDLVSSPRDAVAEIQTAKGVLRAVIPRKRTIASNPHLLLVWMAVTASALVVVAVMFLRNQVRPIKVLAAAAEAFGKGRAAPFRPSGAEEVRRAGAAFLEMRRRIERQIDQRTRMLSAVSHDLRTPLTRMKLALAMADPGPETDQLTHDVAQMERMLTEFLDFSRGEGTEPAAMVDPAVLLRGVVEDARRSGHDVTLTLPDPWTPISVSLRADAVTRALTNLIDNAARYGMRAEASLRVNRRAVEFVIEDDGPGIPPEAREAAFRPFTRLDEARNQDKGGVGLGLSIALDVARAHGGTVKLDRSETMGGLKAVVRLPR